MRANVNRRPNILWYCTDQQRYDTIAALGNAFVNTPAMDSLVEQGAAFASAYCQSPICTPSRASFLTGMYPSAVGANKNGMEFFPQSYPLITKTLAELGWECGLVGKLHLATAAGGVEPRVDDGYSYTRYSHAPRDDWTRGHDYVEWLRARGVDLESMLADPANVPAEHHQTTWCSDMAIDFIERPRNGPWLLSVNPYYPHPPFDPPQSYLERLDVESMPGPLFRESDLTNQSKLTASGVDFQSTPSTPQEMDAKAQKARYYAMIELVDDQLARILRAIDRSGETENTLIILSSDHGEALGDHGLIFKGCRFFEGLSRVPLIFCWPGTIQSGLRSDALVELTDIVPTILEIAGRPVPEGMHGKSLLPILLGHAPTDRHRDHVRCEYFDAVDLPDHTYATMFRDNRWKLVVYHGKGVGEIYDLKNDPNEFENLWDSPATRDIKADLLLRSYDAAVESMNHGPERVAPI